MAKKSKFSIGRKIITEARKNTDIKIQDLQKKGYEVSQYDRNDIYKKEKKNAKKRFAIKSAVAALGLSGLLFAGAKALDAGNTPEPRNKVVFEDISDINNETLDSSKENTTKQTEHQKFAENIKISDSDLSFQNDIKSPQEMSEDEISDSIIQSIIESYNEKYGTSISFDTLKYLQTTDELYVYEGKDGDYIYDPSIIYDKNRNYTPAGGNYALMYSILDESDHIIFSVGEFKTSNKSEAEYKLVEVITAYGRTQRKIFQYT